MRCILALLLVPTTACTSVEALRPDLAARSVPSRLDEIAYINTLREAFDFKTPSLPGCYVGRRLDHFRPSLEQGWPEHEAEQEQAAPEACVTYRRLKADDRDAAIQRYLEAGFGLTDLYCQRYFVIAAESMNKRRFQRDTSSTVGTLVNAVLGAASAGEDALAITTAGFGAIDSTYKNIDTAFLVAPEIENTRKLVHAAQQEYRTSAYAAMPVSYESARSVIERYAGLCSYTGMKQLVNDSVSSETKDLNKAAANGGQPKSTTTAKDLEGAAKALLMMDVEAAVPVPITPRR